MRPSRVATNGLPRLERRLLGHARTPPGRRGRCGGCMAGHRLSMVAVCGASASRDSVRRAIWLPRAPDGRQRLREVVRAATRPGPIAITQHEAYVLVHGLSALSFHREW